MTAGPAERSATRRAPARRTQPAKTTTTAARAPARRTQPAKTTTTAARAPARRAQTIQAPAATPGPARPAAPATARPAPARTAKPAPARAAKPAAPKAAAAPRTSSASHTPLARPAKATISPARPAQRAVATAIEKQARHLVLPYGIGPVRVPSPDRLAFYGGIAALALFGIVEWPVALVIGVGHLLADDHHHKLLADFGEALGEA
jgi:hypothetical protein